MSDHPSINRRDFTLQSALAILSAATITISCDDDTPTRPSTDVTGAVSANHGHQAVIERARLTGGGAITLDIRGSADHPHTVQLTAAEVGQIAAGQRVTKESSTDAFHSHQVSFN